MSAPEGPDQPRWNDPTAPPPEQYPDPSYRQAPYEPYNPPAYEQQPPPQQPYQQQPYQQQPYQQGAPPYQQQPYEQQYPPQQPDPASYQQQPDPGQVPPYGDQYGSQYGDQYGSQYGNQFGGPQYGAPPYGGYPLTAPKRPSNRTPLIIAAVAVVVIALAVVGVVVFTRGDDNKKAAQTPPPTTSAPARSSSASAPTSSAPPTSAAAPSVPATPTTVQQITVPAVVSGWHGVLSYKENVAYDVPPDWKVETPGTLVGFEDNDGQPIAIMHGVSTYKDEACPGVSGSYRGHTGFKTAGDTDPETAAHTGLQTFAQGVALKDNGSSAPISRTTITDTTVDQGKIKAKYARATVTLNDKSDCGSPTVVVVAVAFRTAPNATALFIGYFDQGVSDALPLATLSKIFTTLRPYKR